MRPIPPTSTICTLFDRRDIFDDSTWTTDSPATGGETPPPAEENAETEVAPDTGEEPAESKIVTAELSARQDELQERGFCVLKGVYSKDETQALTAQLEAILHHPTAEASIRNRSGTVYAARNILDLWPGVQRVWKKPRLEAFLAETLGDDFGLVRVLYFDKPPEQTWALPWHKDLTIAIVPPDHFPAESALGEWSKLTFKAGVPHVEADCETLSRMLTLRIHLDSTDAENGALRVIPGSQRSGKSFSLSSTGELVTAASGDVLAIRPLVTHCSGQSKAGTIRHRRVLHLEFSGTRTLPHGFQWRDFIR